MLEIDDENDEKKKKVRFGINKRPYLKYFLVELKKDFEVIVFTASGKCYANAILRYLDPDKTIFDYAFYRNSCI